MTSLLDVRRPGFLARMATFDRLAQGDDDRDGRAGRHADWLFRDDRAVEDRDAALGNRRDQP